MLEYNEQTENLMEIAMMLEQLKGESEYLFEVLTDIDSITWKQGRLVSGRPGRSNPEYRPGSNPGKSRQAVEGVPPDI